MHLGWRGCKLISRNCIGLSTGFQPGVEVQHMCKATCESRVLSAKGSVYDHGFSSCSYFKYTSELLNRRIAASAKRFLPLLSPAVLSTSLSCLSLNYCNGDIISESLTPSGQYLHQLRNASQRQFFIQAWSLWMKSEAYSVTTLWNYTLFAF